jgi:hypothetical protein
MEVLLPPDFHKDLIHPNIEGMSDDVMPIIKINKSICLPGCSTEYVRFFADRRNFSKPGKCGSRYHSVSFEPNAAIYSTLEAKMTTHYITNGYCNEDCSIPEHDKLKCLIFNDTDKLLTINMKKDLLNELLVKDTDFCIIQNLEQYSQFALGVYPSNITELSVFLNEKLSDYGDEPRYKINRRQVFLIRAFGTAAIGSEQFNDLLKVDCDLLYKTVTRVFDELNVPIYRCSFHDRPGIMDLVHSKLVTKKSINVDVDDIKLKRFFMAYYGVTC